MTRKILQHALEPIFVQWRITKKKTEIISDQKSALVINVYMERKSRFLRAKSALVECLLYL